MTSPITAFDEIITIKNSFTVKETVDYFEQVLNGRDMTLFNRIKRSNNAKSIGIELCGTKLIIFDNPKADGQLIKCQQSVAIDLPQKTLIWKGTKAKA